MVENTVATMQAVNAFVVSGCILNTCKIYPVLASDTFKSRIRWDANTNVPYIITGSGRLECQFGKDRDKERKEQRKKQSLQNIVRAWNLPAFV